MITVQDLEALNFSLIPGRPGRYSYKGFVGQLLENGTYTFLGFNPPITTLADLKYMLMLIDYNEQASSVGYPHHEN
jgi:hypothetical protein